MALSASERRSNSLLYPERRKCRKCQGRFYFIILDRMYCSYDCAGVPAPDAASKPRSCWTTDDKPKMGFFTPDEADRFRRHQNIDDLVSYYCVHHHFWHVGHSRTDGTGSVDAWYEDLQKISSEND